jgi:hypothetical protein
MDVYVRKDNEQVIHVSRMESMKAWIHVFFKFWMGWFRMVLVGTLAYPSIILILLLMVHGSGFTFSEYTALLIRCKGYMEILYLIAGLYYGWSFSLRVLYLKYIVRSANKKLDQSEL